jgi:hypothetical protein
MANKYDNYKHVPITDIASFLRGEPEANLRIKKRYYWYISECLVDRAVKKYQLDPKDIPIVELIDEVWNRVTLVMMEKFSIR